MSDATLVRQNMRTLRAQWIENRTARTLDELKAFSEWVTGYMKRTRPWKRRSGKAEDNVYCVVGPHSRTANGWNKFSLIWGYKPGVVSDKGYFYPQALELRDFGYVRKRNQRRLRLMNPFKAAMKGNMGTYSIVLHTIASELPKIIKKIEAIWSKSKHGFRSRFTMGTMFDVGNEFGAFTQRGSKLGGAE